GKVGMGGAEDTPLDRDGTREGHDGQIEGPASGVERTEAGEGHGDLQLAAHDATLQDREPLEVQRLRLVETSPRLDDRREGDEVGGEIGRIALDVGSDRDAPSSGGFGRLK